MIPTDFLMDSQETDVKSDNWNVTLLMQIKLNVMCFTFQSRPRRWSSNGLSFGTACLKNTDTPMINYCHIFTNIPMVTTRLLQATIPLSREIWKGVIFNLFITALFARTNTSIVLLTVYRLEKIVLLTRMGLYQIKKIAVSYQAQLVKQQPHPLWVSTGSKRYSESA